MTRWTSTMSASEPLWAHDELPRSRKDPSLQVRIQERRILLVPLHDLLILWNTVFEIVEVPSAGSLPERILDLLHEPVDFRCFLDECKLVIIVETLFRRGSIFRLSEGEVVGCPLELVFKRGSRRRVCWASFAPRKSI